MPGFLGELYNKIREMNSFKGNMIKTLESGGTIEGLNDLKQIINVEVGFDARTITQADIDRYGLGD